MSLIVGKEVEDLSKVKDLLEDLLRSGSLAKRVKDLRLNKAIHVLTLQTFIMLIESN